MRTYLFGLLAVNVFSYGVCVWLGAVDRWLVCMAPAVVAFVLWSWFSYRRQLPLNARDAVLTLFMLYPFLPVALLVLGMRDY